jgi:hypothetical protein
VWGRNTKISSSFEASLRVSSASQANVWDTARYTRRKGTSAEDRSPAQMRCTSSGTRQASAPRALPQIVADLVTAAENQTASEQLAGRALEET